MLTMPDGQKIEFPVLLDSNGDKFLDIRKLQPSCVGCAWMGAQPARAGAGGVQAPAPSALGYHQQPMAPLDGTSLPALPHLTVHSPHRPIAALTGQPHLPPRPQHRHVHF